MSDTDTRPATRLYFLDWVRILAFFILIAYHVGMYYVSWDWHVKSPAAGTAPEPFMLLSAPWRLSLLFLISGVASSFMLARESVQHFLRQRTVRLLVPLVFGMLVVVPAQPYLEAVEKVHYAGSYLDFMRLYVTGYGGFCRNGSCLALPTWNHLWFVPYLWCYTLGLAALVALLGKRFDALAGRAGRLLTGWRIVVLPAAVLACIRIMLISRYPENHSLAGDWFNHANYFFLFTLGALLARAPQSWPRLESLRWPCLAIAAAGWSVLVVWWALPDNAIPPAELEAWRVLMRTVFATLAWCAICAACGFAHRHLQHDNTARRYLTEAVFPVYIAHQTLIVVLAHALKPVHLSPGVEALVLIVMTATGSFGTFELVRRVPLLRPLFGLAPRTTLPAIGRPPADALARLT
jgi:surface polysaccharide O-acyltransferase-like enzyme